MTAPLKEKNNMEKLEDELKKPVFRGHRRIFLLVLALALLMQTLSFMHLQTAVVKDKLISDFKIILSVPDGADNALIEEMGMALSSAKGAEGARFISSSDAFEEVRQASPALADAFVYLGRRPMPDYFEITLNYDALAALDVWLKENVQDAYPALKPAYKPLQAKTAVYAGLLENFLGVTALLFLALLAAFIFFIESYYTDYKIDRFGGAFSGALAWGCSLLAVWALLRPISEAGGELWVFTTYYRQAVIFLAAALSGWTLVKWKRF